MSKYVRNCVYIGTDADGMCRLATRFDPPDALFMQKALSRGLRIERVMWEEAIRRADAGFKKSLRMLRASVDREGELEAQLSAEGCIP